MADFRSTKTCAEIDEILNNAVLVGNDGDDGTQNTLLGLKKGLTLEINGKQNTILDLDDIRNKSKSAVQPTDLSAVATSGSYNDLSNKPVYITPFTVVDLENIIGDSEQSIDIRIDFIDAIVAKKVILIPNSFWFGGGYVVATNIDGYKGDIDAGAHLEFWVARNRFVLDIDNSINDDSTITITGADISIEGIPDWTSIERKKEVVSISTPAIEVLQPNKIYVNHSGRLSNLTISSLETTTNLIDEYTLHFGASGAGLVSLPDYVKWANGEVPTLAAGSVYELSIVKTTISGTDYFKAVLTRFA